MGVCSICGKTTTDRNTVIFSYYGAKIPLCDYCNSKVRCFDNCTQSEKEETKQYLREQIISLKINKLSIPILDYCLGKEEVDYLLSAIDAAVSNNQNVKSKKEQVISYYNGKKYAIELAIAIICGIATFIIFQNNNKFSLFWLIVPIASLFSLLLSSIERKKPRK